MPFPIDLKYIEESEKELGLIFPPIYKSKMLKKNGGEAGTEDEGWTLFPFFDKLDNKRISRTANHIVRETKGAGDWTNFPENAVAIGENGSGDYLILITDSDTANTLSEIPYSWSHETAEIHPVGNSILDILEPDDE